MASDNKYDRQERLWGVTGQRSLRASRILLLGCSPSGIECLKNLVLPACGEIFIIDNRKVTPKDLSNNFFVTKEDLGKSIAQVCCQNLLEMNEDVKGQFQDRDYNEVIGDEEFLKGFSAVIANELREQQIKVLSQSCYNLRYVSDTKLFVLNTMGIVGLLRNQLNTHFVLNPQSPGDFFSKGNLYIQDPFESLQKLADSYDFEFLQDQTKLYYQINQQIEEKSKADEKFQEPEDFGTIKQNYLKYKYAPLPIILIKAYQIWFKTNTTLPTKRPDQVKFKEILKPWYDFLHYDDQVCFREAIQDSHPFRKAIINSNKQLTPNLLRLFEHPECVNQCPKSSDFWVIVRALQLFIQKTGFLPVTCLDFPDFTTQTKTYLDIRHLYKEKQDQDIQTINQIAKEISGGRQVSQVLILEIVQRVTQVTFCDNTPIFQQNLANFKTTQQQKFLQLQVFQGLLEFQDTLQKPYSHQENSQDFKNWLNQKNINAPTNIIDEISQCQGTQLHSFASTLGSIAAQEALKAITHQFTPLENTYFYNSLTTTSLTVKITN